MAIDFTGFKTIVDAVGGVTIDNPVAFSYTWSEEHFHAQVWEWVLRRGALTPGGRPSLRAQRYNSVPAIGDFARSVRQQRVLAAPAKWGGWARWSGPHYGRPEGPMKTDLSAIDLAPPRATWGPIGASSRLRAVILEATGNSIGQHIWWSSGAATVTTRAGPGSRRWRARWRPLSGP
jgi:hypothetical protein